MTFFPILFAALDHESDRALAERLKAREPEALRDLYDRYGGLTYALILRIVRNAAAAEALTMETFLRVATRMPAFDPQRGALGAWVLTMARNRAVDYLRTVDGGRTDGELELTAADAPGLFSDMDASILTGPGAARVRMAFSKLTEQQRMVLELVYFEGLPVAAIAGRTGQPEAAVRHWIRGAYAALREEREAPAIA